MNAQTVAASTGRGYTMIERPTPAMFPLLRPKPARAGLAAVILLALVAGLGLTATSASATGTVIYNDFPSVPPGSVPSRGLEKIHGSQLGGEIDVASGSLTNTALTIGLVSLACQSGSWEAHNCVTTPGAKFEMPITLHINATGEGNAVGTEVGRLTQVFKVPYRPSDSSRCVGGGWGRECASGKLFKVKYKLRGVVMPEPAIISVSYNTSHYGVEPGVCAVGCPNDFIELAQEVPPASEPAVGSQPFPADDFLNSLWELQYCDHGAGGLGIFRLDAGCRKAEQPLIAVETS
jgi:hypothetical protein